MTVRDATESAAARLSAVPELRTNALLDARQLVELATGRTRVQLLSRPDDALSAAEQVSFADLLQRRLRSEPMQHLRGSQEFYGREFLVSRDVLIPRPETEDIVTAVLEATPDRNTPLRIADVGTGSGALAVTLALELPISFVTAYDISSAALAMAGQNAHRLGAADRVALFQSDLLSSASEGECFDVIVSNPPYIPTGESASLHSEVRDYEPHLALFAGEDGHDVYRRLIPEAYVHLAAGGLLLLETGGRVDLILDLLRDWDDVRVRPDLQGIARIVSARRH